MESNNNRELDPVLKRKVFRLIDLQITSQLRKPENDRLMIVDPKTLESLRDAKLVSDDDMLLHPFSGRKFCKLKSTS